MVEDEFKSLSAPVCERPDESIPMVFNVEDTAQNWLAPAPEQVIAKETLGIVSFSRKMSFTMEEAVAVLHQAERGLTSQALTSPQAVANFFLDCGHRDGRPLTPLKLIKLVCIAHGWSLAALDAPLFNEPVQAWSFGPVVPSLYHEFKIFRKTPINRYACEYDFSGNLLAPKIAPEQTQLRELLAKLWDIYKNFSAAQLVALTHQEGTPWSMTRSASTDVIDNELIRNHYIQLLSKLV